MAIATSNSEQRSSRQQRKKRRLNFGFSPSQFYSLPACTALIGHECSSVLRYFATIDGVLLGPAEFRQERACAEHLLQHRIVIEHIHGSLVGAQTALEVRHHPHQARLR